MPGKAGSMELHLQRSEAFSKSAPDFGSGFEKAETVSALGDGLVSSPSSVMNASSSLLSGGVVLRGLTFATVTPFFPETIK